MNKGYKGLYLKEMRKVEELEGSLKKSKDTEFRLKMAVLLVSVGIGVMPFIVFLNGGFR